MAAGASHECLAEVKQTSVCVRDASAGLNAHRWSLFVCVLMAVSGGGDRQVGCTCLCVFVWKSEVKQGGVCVRWSIYFRRLCQG